MATLAWATHPPQLEYNKTIPRSTNTSATAQAAQQPVDKATYWKPALRRQLRRLAQRQLQPLLQQRRLLQRQRLLLLQRQGLRLLRGLARHRVRASRQVGM
jgi:hypothetical protein